MPSNNSTWCVDALTRVTGYGQLTQALLIDVSGVGMMEVRVDGLNP